MTFGLTIYDASLLFLSAFVYSLIEIEIEGKHGWCEKLPTAKKSIGEFTLYHIYMIIFVVILISMIFIPRFYIACNNSEFSPWSAVCCFFFYLLAWFLLEDFLWFVFNPFYTLSKYNKENVLWHKHWIAGMPLHNLLGFLLLLALAFAEGSGYLFAAFLILAVWTCVVSFAAPNYHSFYFKIRGKDAEKLQ